MRKIQLFVFFAHSTKLLKPTRGYEFFGDNGLFVKRGSMS